jgi:serine protease Do
VKSWSFDMRVGAGLVFFAAFLIFTGRAIAEDLSLASGQRWVTVASSKDRDTAIGIARLYEASRARVALSENGWYAVIFGPVSAASITAYRKTYPEWPDLPADARLSSGESFRSIVWQPAKRPAAIPVTANRPANVMRSGVEFTARLIKEGENSRLRLVGKAGATELFSLETQSEAFAGFGTAITVARLDPVATVPQVMITRNTGGAHCCVETVFATGAGGTGWTLVSGLTLDGNGYWLEDLDGDGSQELMSYDNSFLYAFDSYAGSFAPIHVSRLAGKTLSDISRESRWRSRLAQDLAGMEFQASLDPSFWHSNGFLAAWVAAKMRLGDGGAAWSEMLKNYDRNSDFGPQVCTDGSPVDQCPEDRLKKLPFPAALAAHLKEQGYGEAPGQ